VSDGDPHEASVGIQHRRPTVQSVEAVVDRAQRLVDSRPKGEYPVAWCIEVSSVGDLTAIAALAAMAGRAAEKAS